MRPSFARPLDFRGRIAAVALSALVFLPLAIFVVRYVLQEKYIYYWDYVQYHQSFRQARPRFLLNPFHALDFVFRTIRERDYNLLPTVFLVPFRIAFGPGRMSYILSVTVVYGLPSLVLFALFMKQLRGRNATQVAFEDAGLTLIPVLSLALMPQFWSPVLQGYVDVGGLVILFAVLLLYSRADLAEHGFWTLVSIALLLSLLILFRRWYAYWVVGFFAAIGMCEGLRLAQDKERRASWTLLVRNALILGVISILATFLIAAPIARKMLTTDYRDIYSAYRSSRPIAENLAALRDHFGLLILALAGLGFLFSLREARRRYLVCFLCVQFAVTFALFTRTQNFVVYAGPDEFGGQHFYWAVGTAAAFVALLVQDVFLWARAGIAKAAVLAAFLALCAANFSAAFLPGANVLLHSVEFALPRVRQYPMVRTDLDQIRALLDTLTGLSGDSESTIYILASSYLLNSSSVHEACLHLEPAHTALAYKIAATSDVDKRDGFPIPFLMARYVVLTVPFGYHLAPQDQRVIGVLADQLMNAGGIGKSYEKLNFAFRLEDGSDVFIYKKVRPLDPADVKRLSNKFLEFYPSHKELFLISPDVIRQVSAL